MTPPDTPSLGTRLRARRRALGYTTTQLATVLGMTAAQVQRLERDLWTHAIPRSSQRRLAAVLGCSIAALGVTPRHRPRGTAGAAPTTLGARLRERRMGRGLTQQALGRRLAVSAPTICRWELDRVQPRPVMLTRLARMLQCRVHDLTHPCPSGPLAGDEEEQMAKRTYVSA